MANGRCNVILVNILDMKKLVIIPGGFHPFHAGHLSLYKSAQESFPNADIYIAATADTSERPFPFEYKQKLAQLAGIPKHRFIQVKSPFRANEITQSYDPDTTQLIFARSEKDSKEQPLPGGTKKDGSPAYLQPYKRRGLEPMSKHGYMVYLPTVQFGPGMTSATEVRSKWPTLSQESKLRLVHALYPKTKQSEKLAGVAIQVFDKILNTETAVAEGYKILPPMDKEKYQERQGLEGPFSTLSGKVVYYDPQEGKYYDPDTDMYISYNDFRKLDNDYSDVKEGAVLRNDPEHGIEIRPAGGMGTWDEKSLVSSLSAQFKQIVEMMKYGNYRNMEHLLYNNGAMESKVKALARLEDFKEKQGRRPIAKGREIDIGEDYLDESSPRK